MICKRWIRFLLFWINVLNLGDIVSTYGYFMLDGITEEGNSLMFWSFQTFGIPLTFIAKFCLILLISSVGLSSLRSSEWKESLFRRRFLSFGLSIVVVFFALLVVSNTAQMVLLMLRI